MRAIGFGLIAALAFAVPAAAQRAPEIAGVADRLVAQGSVPGIVVAVGRGDAAPAITARGRIGNDAHSPAADENSLWRIYSMTKPITGIAAMILIEQGKLGLDDPISKYIPAFKDMKVLIDPAKGLESRPAARPITVRHLLTHTAGLGYNIITQGPLLNEYNRLGINPAAVSAALEVRSRPARPASLEEFANRVASLPLIADPGAKWSYSIGLDVLGRVIEVAGGMPFDRFVTTRIFAPLKMQSSYWTVPASEAPRLADNFATLGGTRVVMDPGKTSAWLTPPSFPYGGAGLVMSARDYDRFLHMLLSGGQLGGARILKPQTVRLAMSNLLPAGADASLLNVNRESGVTLGFGAGGSVYLADAPGGAGRGTFGWGGAAGTIGWVDPVHKLRVTVMINLFGDTPLRKDTTRAIFADLGK
ncbi:serine hydrolase domain-containing protein [Sphingomonas sp.]|jgi:CubicO group peptidase (beta-lactamase class C family)|uniref:serine hydrolase domain-containing protein n=1 Tax=Sphingomonas sp. TaxID=28214 RepID=UPI002ED89FA5